MNLPEPLEPWADAFAVVAPDVALSLGPVLTRLAAAVGPLKTRTVYGRGDPDGYDGLTRRGAYERLLLSEWALAEEAPDEFLRRAATRELGFHQLMHRETAKARTSVALFDEGPSQIGAPRIAHLAALLLLAKRARDAGARFAWGVLQQPPGAPGSEAGLRLDVTPENVDLLRVARQAMRPVDSDLDAWAELEARGGHWDDLWIIGPRETALRWRERVGRRAGATGGSIELREPEAPGVRALYVQVRQRAIARDVTLDLPDDASCVRLVRNPLRRVDVKKPEPQVARMRPNVPNALRPVLSNALLLSNGSKAVARTSDGALLVFGVPGSSRGGTPRPRIVMPRPGERILAAGWGYRRLVMLSFYLGALRLHDWNGNVFPWDASVRAATDLAREALLDLDREDLLATVHVHRETPSSPRTGSVLDRGRRIWRLDPGGVVQVAHDVETLYVQNEGLLVFQRPSSELSARNAFPMPFNGDAVVECAPRAWCFEKLGGARGEELTRTPGNARVIGVMRPNSAKAPTVVYLDADGVTFWQVTVEMRTRVHASKSPVATAAVDPAGHRIVYTTADGGLSVYDHARADELMRYVPGGAR